MVGTVHYTVKKSKRAKKARITIRPSGEVFITVPYRMPIFLAKRLLNSKKVWIEECVKNFETQRLENIKNGFLNPITAEEKLREFKTNKEKAHKILVERVESLSKIYNVSYGTIRVRNQKTRWGSCSKSGNLSFNYNVAFLEPLIRDYVVVHELCHLKEFNHSKKFWDLVEIGSPEYKQIRIKMRTLGALIQ